MEPATVWDQLVESALSQASTTALPNSSKCKMILAKEARQKFRPEIERSIGLIDPPIRQAIRGLVNGELPWPLLLNGPAGVGKTCAALCLVDHCPFSRYWRLSQLCEILIQANQGKYSVDSPTGGVDVYPVHIWDWIIESPLVVIDEVGCRDRAGDFVYETFWRVLDERHRRPLVCLSNLSIEGIEKIFDDRVASRLSAGTVIRLEGKDRRKP